LQVSPPTFAGKVNRHERTLNLLLRSTRSINLVLSSVSVILPSKLLLHELIQLIGIKLLTYGFLEFFWFLVPISGGGTNAHSPGRTPMPKMFHGASLVLNFS